MGANNSMISPQLILTVLSISCCLCRLHLTTIGNFLSIRSCDRATKICLPWINHVMACNHSVFSVYNTFNGEIFSHNFLPWCTIPKIITCSYFRPGLQNTWQFYLITSGSHIEIFSACVHQSILLTRQDPILACLWEKGSGAWDYYYTVSQHTYYNTPRAVVANSNDNMSTMLFQKFVNNSKTSLCQLEHIHT